MNVNYFADSVCGHRRTHLRGKPTNNILPTSNFFNARFQSNLLQKKINTSRRKREVFIFYSNSVTLSVVEGHVFKRALTPIQKTRLQYYECVSAVFTGAVVAIGIGNAISSRFVTPGGISTSSSVNISSPRFTIIVSLPLDN